MKTVNLVIASILFACGAPEDEFDLGQDDLGQENQELGTKFSTLYSAGASLDPKRSECTVSAGGGPHGITYYNCMLPGTTAITYQVTGTDPYACPGPDCDSYFRTSYKDEVGTAVFRLNAGLDAAVPSNPWTFTQVTVQPATVTVTSGSCPGDPISSNNIQTFVCTSWPAGTTVTESLSGVYKRWNTGMFITVDVAHLQARAALDIGSSGSFKSSYHQLMEHGIMAAWYQAVGIGTVDRNQGYWNDSRVELSMNLGQGSGLFNSNADAAGDKCRAGNYTGASQSTFAALTGSCVNDN